jgi:hypothetical protein
MRNRGRKFQDILLHGSCSYIRIVRIGPRLCIWQEGLVIGEMKETAATAHMKYQQAASSPQEKVINWQNNQDWH